MQLRLNYLEFMQHILFKRYIPITRSPNSLIPIVTLKIDNFSIIFLIIMKS